MLNWIKNRLSPTPQAEQITVSRDKHPISRNDISENALKVLYRLKKAGFKAYLVGGGVRDLLLGQQPKDFDITTDAHPEQIHKLFSNSRIIGRRFKLVHVLYGRDMIEVATFRGSSNQAEHPHAATSDTGLILRDNIYGSIEEDAIRRDFTVNALYYNIEDFAIYDFAQGLRDIETKTLRLIGNPAERYKEDPVRMLRAVRFASKLNFKIAKGSAAPIHEYGDLLQQIPAARLFDEMLKLFLSANAHGNFTRLREFNLFQHLFPLSEDLLKRKHPHARGLLEHAFQNTDQRIRNNKPVTPAYLLAALLWYPMREEMEKLQQRMPLFPSFHQASGKILEQQAQHTSIPRRFAAIIKEIWELQFRLPKRKGKRALQYFEHRRFRASYDFILLREQAGEKLDGLGDWWTRYQDVSEQEQAKMVSALEPEKPSRKPRRRKPKKSAQ